jgi:arginyl-tRNA--protein-N-Asp/Glu arginylyltransferase
VAYSNTLHDKEEITEASYERFLCTPILGFRLLNATDPQTGEEYYLPLGSVHFKYYLRDRLIAVAVSDITPW